MPTVQRDKRGLYIKYMDRYARPSKDGLISPLAPRGTHIREHALVVVELFSGDSQRLLVTVAQNGKFNEVWYFGTPVKQSQRKKTDARKHKTKRPVRRRNVGTTSRSRKKVGNKGSSRPHNSVRTVGSV